MTCIKMRWPSKRPLPRFKTTCININRWWKNKKFQLIIAALVGTAITIAIVAGVRNK